MSGCSWHRNVILLTYLFMSHFTGFWGFPAEPSSATELLSSADPVMFLEPGFVFKDQGKTIFPGFVFKDQGKLFFQVLYSKTKENYFSRFCIQRSRKTIFPSFVFKDQGKLFSRFCIQRPRKTIFPGFFARGPWLGSLHSWPTSKGMAI